MTERELFEAIGHVDDDLILAADAPVKKRRRAVMPDGVSWFIRFIRR